MTKLSFCNAVDVPQKGKIPGVLIIVDGDAAALIEDDIPWPGGNLPVGLGKSRADTAYLLKPAIIAHIHGQRSFGQQPLPRCGRGIVLQGRSPDRIADLKVHLVFLLRSFG